MEGLILPLDVIHSSLCPYFSLSTLALCQRVSRSWFSIFIADASYAHIRRRICATIPLFIESFPWVMMDQVNRTVTLKPSKAKKLKLAWIFPRTGTWRVFKRLKNNYCNLYGARVACSKGETDIVASILKLNFEKEPISFVYRNFTTNHGIHWFNFQFPRGNADFKLFSNHIASDHFFYEDRAFNSMLKLMGFEVTEFTHMISQQWLNLLLW